jgi:hypothetical protein
MFMNYAVHIQRHKHLIKLNVYAEHKLNGYTVDCLLHACITKQLKHTQRHKDLS